MLSPFAPALTASPSARDGPDCGAEKRHRSTQVIAETEYAWQALLGNGGADCARRNTDPDQRRSHKELRTVANGLPN